MTANISILGVPTFRACRIHICTTCIFSQPKSRINQHKKHTCIRGYQVDDTGLLFLSEPPQYSKFYVQTTGMKKEKSATYYYRFLPLSNSNLKYLTFLLTPTNLHTYYVLLRTNASVSYANSTHTSKAWFSFPGKTLNSLFMI